MTPRPSRFALGLFRTVFLPWMRGRVIVRIPHVPWNVPRDAPLLLVANHISWWDGFALWEVQRMLRPGASLRVVMTAAELERNRVLGWIAAVPIRPGSAGSVLRTFRELRRLREHDPSLVTIYFPQGRIHPSYRRPLDFQRGIATLSRMLAPVTVLPVALHLEPLRDRRPTMFAVPAEPLPVPSGAAVDTAAVEERVATELDRLMDFLSAHGEAAAQLQYR